MGKRLALLVGNSKFDHPALPSLNTPIEDVDDLAELLGRSDVGGFDKVIELIDETDDVIKHAITDLYEFKEGTDLLLLYYSGHGMLDKRGILHLAAKNSDPRRPRVGGISSNFINTLMQETSSRRLILILDCCYSGAFMQSQSKNHIKSTISPEMAFRGSGTGVVILTASTATELAWEGDRLVGNINNSIFTHYLVEALTDGAADHDTDGCITLGEWFNYVSDRMRTEAGEYEQTPTMWVENQQGDDLIIARTPHGSPMPLHPRILDLLESHNTLKQLEGIVELENLLEDEGDEGLRESARVALSGIMLDQTRSDVVRAAALSLIERPLLSAVYSLLEESRSPRGLLVAKGGSTPATSLDELIDALRNRFPDSL